MTLCLGVGLLGTPASGVQAGGPWCCVHSHQCRSSGSSSCAPRPGVGAAEQLRPGPATRCTHKPTAAWAEPAPAREPPLSTRVPCRRREDRARDRPMARPRLRRRGPRWCPSSAPGACGGGAALGSVEAAGGPLCPSHAPSHRCFASTMAGASSMPPQLQRRHTAAPQAAHAANRGPGPGPSCMNQLARSPLEAGCVQAAQSLSAGLSALPATCSSESLTPSLPRLVPPLGEGLSGGRNLSPYQSFLPGHRPGSSSLRPHHRLSSPGVTWRSFLCSSVPELSRQEVMGELFRM